MMYGIRQNSETLNSGEFSYESSYAVSGAPEQHGNGEPCDHSPSSPIRNRSPATR